VTVSVIQGRGNIDFDLRDGNHKKGFLEIPNHMSMFLNAGLN
jgi:hypothetical protein